MCARNSLVIVVVGIFVVCWGAPVYADLSGKIVFDAGEELYLMNAQGGPTVKVLLPDPPLDTVRSPKWSKDGNWIAFCGGPGGNSQIYVVRPDGSDFRRVTDGTGDLVTPSFSPDGEKIVFHEVLGHVLIINFDGTDPPIDLGFNGGNTEWSPDGNRISYTDYGFTYESDIFIYDLVSQTSTQITHHSAGQAFNTASWSPDSTELVVSEWEDNVSDVWRMNADGTNPDPVNLTPSTPGSYENWACWSLDGADIVYRRNTSGVYSGKYDIWSMHRDGSNPINLTDSSLVNEGPPSVGVPEPATLSLLVLGGLALIYRRRV